MLTWKMAHQLITERGLTPTVVDVSEDPELRALCQELQQIQKRQSEIVAEIGRRAKQTSQEKP